MIESHKTVGYFTKNVRYFLTFFFYTNSRLKTVVSKLTLKLLSNVTHLSTSLGKVITLNGFSSLSFIT